MNKFKENYNPKIDFRFLAFANSKIDPFESTYDLRKVFDGEIKATTNNQIDMIKTKESFEMFKKEGFSKETIEKCLTSFNVIVSNSKVQMLLNYINKLDKSDYYDYACKVFMFIIKKSLFDSITNKLAILMFNTIMWKNKTLPIIFYTHNMKSLTELIHSGLSLESLKKILNHLFNISSIYNTPHQFVTRDEVIEMLLFHKNKLEELYDVEHIALTGSYANGLYTEYSDVDFIVTLKNKEKKKELINYLVKQLNMPVDVVLSEEEFAKTTDLKKYQLRIF